MVLEKTIPPFSEWFYAAVGTWSMVAMIVAGVIIAGGYLICALRSGPGRGLVRLVNVLLSAASDLFQTSPRRVLALAWLAIHEARRTRVIVVLGIFGLILFYAGWFLPRGTDPARLYLNSVVPWTTFLVLMVGLLLGTFSLPTDIKNRTIFTIVTKPVRSTEIVFGRFLGFTAVGSVLLAIMSLLSYVFVVRMLNHEHQVLVEEFDDVDLPPSDGQFDKQTIVRRGRLSSAHDHHHRLSINADGFGATDSTAGHWHVVRGNPAPRLRYAKVETGDARRVHLHFTEPMDPVEAIRSQHYQLSDGLRVISATVSEDNRQVTLIVSNKVQIDSTTVTVNDQLKSRLGRKMPGDRSVTIGDSEPVARPSDFEVSNPYDLFRSRVPVYGKLRFTDRDGRPVDRGISVGNVWAYRSFIPGASQSTAIWTFDNITSEHFGDTLPLELTVRVFRTHKGQIGKTLRGSIQLRNPARPGLTSKPKVFYAKDGSIDQQYFTRKLKGIDENGNTVDLDLYKDLASDGKIEVVLRCTESGQLFGVARADAYLLARETTFELNFLKSTLATWFQMTIVIAMGVLASTMLSGPVAVMATITCCIFGYFVDFIAKIAFGTVYGGGPFEAAYRLEHQWNLVRKLEPGILTTFIKMADYVAETMLQCAVHLVPNLKDFSRVHYLADGFDIPTLHIGILGLSALGYVIPMLLLGCLLLKTREVAL